MHHVLYGSTLGKYTVCVNGVGHFQVRILTGGRQDDGTLFMYCGSVGGFGLLFSHMLGMLAPIPQLLVFRGSTDAGRLDCELIHRLLRAWGLLSCNPKRAECSNQVCRRR